jgi:hypothetical protein
MLSTWWRPEWNSVYLVEARVEVDYLHKDRKDAVCLEEARKAVVYLVEARVEVDYLHEDRKDAVYLVVARVENDYLHEDRKDAVYLEEARKAAVSAMSSGWPRSPRGRPRILSSSLRKVTMI